MSLRRTGIFKLKWPGTEFECANPRRSCDTRDERFYYTILVSTPKQLHNITESNPCPTHKQFHSITETSQCPTPKQLHIIATVM